MSQPNRVSRSSIAIVGAGAAGTLTAARLIDEAGRHHRPIEVTLIDPRPTVGRGVAYSTEDNRHLLNVPVRKMTAYPEDAEHFARWLEAHDGRPVDPCDYVPRGRYGQYLAHVLDEAQRRTPWAHVYHVRDRVIDFSYDDRRCRLRLGSGAHVEVDAVVLAVGHLGPELSWVPDSLRASSRFVADPWTAGTLADVDPDGDVLLVGTGLTMVDTVRVLDRPGRVVHATSRHGVLPRRHTPGQLPVMEAPELSSPTPALEELQGVMAFHVAKAVARYDDWRPAIDSIRAMTQRLWAGLSDAERADFVALDARWWDAARHRIPPASAEALDAARDGDRFVVHTARVLEAVETADGLEVTLSDGETLRVAAVVNCAGPCGSPDASTDPLVRSLINLGFARGGPLGIGFDTADDGRLRDIDGRATLPVWTLGSLRRGTLWESTAIPEIRDQAASLAKCLLGPAPVRDRRPRDRHGLALSTTPDAADAWCRALHSICTLQRGAESSLREAVAADPGFAIGHAAHARTHVFYETGDHQGGLRWIDDWIAANADSAEYAAHFSWHAALHELALDDSAAVRRRYVEQLAPPVVAGPRALVDSASLLWRSRLAGAWIDELPIDAVLATVPSCLLDHPATAFAAMHAVVAFAAAGDVDAIGRLRGFAADYTDPTYRELIVPLCDGFAAQVRGEPALAAERLAVVVPAAAQLGGSAAQQEVIAETMVHALVESGQHDAARTFLERRLDRRPRPSDQRRLAALR